MPRRNLDLGFGIADWNKFQIPNPKSEMVRGEGEIWTRIVLFTRQTLFNSLSYFAVFELVAETGLEPVVFGLWDRRFHPIKLLRQNFLVADKGFEPLPLCL